MLSRLFAASCVLGLCAVAQVTTSEPANKTQAALSHWNGDWEVAEDIHRLLGFESNLRESAVTFPSSFRLSLVAHPDRDTDPHQVNYQLLSKIGHSLNATGHWVADAEEMGFTTDRCIVSTDGGRTFLWFTDVPFCGLHGGTVSYIEGTDKGYDLLVIDFNTMPTHLAGQTRGEETIVYRRRKP
jgi:hypothetical protein